MRTLAYVVLSLALVVAVGWGFSEYRQKERLLIEAENSYQQAFHELVYQVDVIHDRTGEALAMNTKDNLTPALTDIWRLTSEAHNAISRLPLGFMPFSKTEEFLANSGTFTYKTAVRDLNTEPLNNEEYSQLESLYKQAQTIQEELRTVQMNVLSKGLKWTDVASAAANGEEPKDNSVTDGFHSIEKVAAEYTEAVPDNPAMMQKQVSDDALKKLGGTALSEKEAATRAKEYFQIDAEITDVTESLKGASVPFYNVAVVGQNGEEASMDIMKKGGYPLTFNINRDVGKTALSLNDAANKSAAFLQKHGFSNMVLTDSTQYGHTGVFTFTKKQDDVIVWPESIVVKAALDNGQVTGFDAQNYWKNKKDRTIQAPALSEKEAVKKLHPKLTVMDVQKAIITNDEMKDVLCYQFSAENGVASYRIFLNAETGQEEHIEKLAEAEQVRGA